MLLIQISRRRRPPTFGFLKFFASVRLCLAPGAVGAVVSVCPVPRRCSRGGGSKSLLESRPSLEYDEVQLARRGEDEDDLSIWRLLTDPGPRLPSLLA